MVRKRGPSLNRSIEGDVLYIDTPFLLTITVEGVEYLITFTNDDGFDYLLAFDDFDGQDHGDAFVMYVRQELQSMTIADQIDTIYIQECGGPAHVPDEWQRIDVDQTTAQRKE